MREKKNCQSCGAVIYYDGLCWKCKEKQKYETYMAMSEDEIADRMAEIIQNVKALPRERKYAAEHDALGDFEALLAYRDINTAALAEAALASELFRPAMLYRDASPATREALIAALLEPDCEAAGDIQTCLAMLGGDRVQDVFMQLEKIPLAWRERLHVNPSVYAEAGGWSFDEAGTRQALVYSTCYAMHDDGASGDRAVQIGKKREERCAVCGCQMMDILTLDGRDERFKFLGIDGVLRVPVCPWCCCFTEDNVISYALDGTSTYTVTIDPYFKENKLKDEYIEEMHMNGYVADEKAATPFRSHGGHRAPTIGGQAEWVQDWTYMSCPACGKKMRYLASIPWECISDGFEGTLYIEICTDCQMVKVLHQQT